MKDFIIDNYQLLIYLVLFILELLLSIILMCKKKSDPAVQEILLELPRYIEVVEKQIGAGCGDQKLNLVLHLVRGNYEKLTGCVFKPGSTLEKFFVAAIESILSTPQKKG